jgi:two-component system probable response regulator PhcQ
MSERPKVLFVDDDTNFIDAQKRRLRGEPYDVIGASSVGEALAILEGDKIDVVVSDEKMPGTPGSVFLSAVFKDYPDIIRIMLTGHGSLEVAIKAINEGQIYRFLTKPCHEVDLKNTIRQSLEHKQLLDSSKRLLRVVQHQSRMLADLEQKNPGITRVSRDSNGAVVIDGADLDFETLKHQIDEEVNHYLDRIGRKKRSV